MAKTEKTAEPAPLANTCGACAYIDARNPSDVFCRRYPPVIVPLAIGGCKCFYPNVALNEPACGEHKPK